MLKISEVTASGLKIARKTIDEQVFAFRLYPKRFQDFLLKGIEEVSLRIPKAYFNVRY